MEIQWPLVLFSLLAGTGGALAAFVGLAGLLGGTRKVRETAALCSIVLVVLGGCFSVLHLAFPLHAISAVTNLLSFSGVSIELMLIGINFVVMAAWLILARREGSEAGLKWVGVVGIVAGLALGFFCGHGYVIEGQPTWNTNVLPFAYLGSSLACGAFLYGVLAVKFGDDGELGGKLGVFTFVCAVIGAVSAVAYAAVLGGSAFSQPLVMWGASSCSVWSVRSRAVFWRCGSNRNAYLPLTFAVLYALRSAACPFAFSCGCAQPVSSICSRIPFQA